MKQKPTWRSEQLQDAVIQLFGTSSQIYVIDTETTGFKADRDRVIQFSGIRFDIVDGVLLEKERYDTYINPGFPLPEKIIEVTGITDDTLATAPSEGDVFANIRAFLGDCPNICAHNAAFDLRFMCAMYERHEACLTPKVILDTLEMARDHACAGTKPENNKLETLAKHFGVERGLTFHNSMDDVIACARLLQIFSKEYKEKVASRPVCNPWKRKVQVKSLRFWEGWRGHSRIYIYTSCGDFYYDVFNKTWGKGSSCFYELEEIDMEALRADAFKLANAETEREFARFRG